MNVNKNQLINNIFEIKLKGIKQITNLSNIFYGCELLSSLPDISKLNIKNVKGMIVNYYHLYQIYLTKILKKSLI